MRVKKFFLNPSSSFHESKFDAYFTIVVSFVYALFGGSLITYDGRQYLSTANSITQLSLVDGYLFGRPPMYPMFLSGVLTIWNSDRFLIFAQVGLMITSILFLFRVFKRYICQIFPDFGIPRYLPYLFVFSPTILGYGSTVLQQSLFVSEAAIILALLIKMAMNPKSVQVYIWFSIMIMITTLTGQGMLPYIAGALACASLMFVRHLRASKFSLRYLLLGFLLYSSLPLTLMSFSFFEEWGLKNSAAVSVSLPQGTSLTEFPAYFRSDPQRALNNIFEALVTQSGLAPSIQAKGLIAPDGNGSASFFENRIHAESIFTPARKCGIADTYSEGSWYETSLNVLEQTCAIYSIPSSFQFLPFAIGFFISILSFLFFPFCFVFLYLSVRRRDKDLMFLILSLTLPSLLLRSSHILLGLQPDRYALPTLPANFLLFLFLIYTLGKFPWPQPKSILKKIEC